MTSGAGKLYWQYSPDSIDAAQMTDENGLSVFGILLNAPIPGPRIEIYENDTLRFENEKTDGMTFFTLHENYVDTGTDAFGDGVFIGNGYGCLNVLNNRWTITLPVSPDINPPATAIEAGDARILGRVYQSTNGFDWSMPRVLSFSSSDANMRSTERANLLVFNNDLFWLGDVIAISDGNMASLGYSPSLTDITAYCTDIDITIADMLSGSFNLDNSTGWLDAHATLKLNQPWLIKIYAGLPGGNSALIGTCLTEAIVREEQFSSRKIPVSFRDLLVLMTDWVKAEEAHILEPVAMMPNRDRDANLLIMNGSGKILNGYGHVFLDLNSMILRADTAEMQNLKWNLDFSTISTGMWVIRASDAENYIRFTVAASTTLVVDHFLAGKVFETTNYTFAAIPTDGIQIIIRYGVIYFCPVTAASNPRAWVAHVINNTMRLAPAYLSDAISDSLYRGAVGYITGGTENTFESDHVVTQAPLMSVERTIRHLAARAGIFNTVNRNVLPTTWSGSATETVTTSTDQFKRLSSIKVTAPSAAFDDIFTSIDQADRTFNFLYTPTSNGQLRVDILGSGVGNYRVEVLTNMIVITRPRPGEATEVMDNVAWRRFVPNGNTRIDIGFTLRKHVTVVTTTPVSGANPQDPTVFNPSYDWFWGIVVYVNGQQFLAWTESPAQMYSSEFISYPSSGLQFYLWSDSNTVGTTITNPFMSSMQQWSDPITIDPGETAISSMARVTEGLNVRVQMRYDGTLAAFAYEDAQQNEPAVITFDRSALMNHIRLVGAYVEDEATHPQSIEDAGHRFAIVNNPYMYSVQDCYRDALRKVNRSVEEAEKTEVTLNFLPFIENEDHITVRDQADAARNIAVVSQSIRGNFIAPTHNIAGRKSPL
jgi:hypothetical protein